MPANNLKILFYLSIIILALELASSCGAKNEEREQNSSTPREGPAAEYPGSKENDSIWHQKHDSSEHKPY